MKKVTHDDDIENNKKLSHSQTDKIIENADDADDLDYTEKNKETYRQRKYRKYRKTIEDSESDDERKL